MTTGLPVGEAFELTARNVIPYLVRRGVIPDGVRADVEELTGGISATVLAVRTPATAVVAKPGRVPRVLDNDPSAHVVVMELLPDDALNWQSEVAAGRAHVDVGPWAGETLGLWHARTAGDPEVAAAFDDFESFEQQRLSPFYETVVERLPEAADDVTTRLEELRARRCFVDGDFAMKNTLVGRCSGGTPPTRPGSTRRYGRSTAPRTCGGSARMPCWQPRSPARSLRRVRRGCRCGSCSRRPGRRCCRCRW